MKSIKQTCELTGISKKALYHYEDIGLIVPIRKSNGYRYYTDLDILKLKRILLFKEMDFSLAQIAQFLGDDKVDSVSMFSLHKDILIAKRNRLNGVIQMVDSEIKGENNMSFKGFDMTEVERAKKEYTSEAKEKWGDSDAFNQSAKKTSAYTKEDWKRIQDESNEIFAGFSKLSDVKSDEAIKLVQMWKNHISAYYYDCTDEILSGLADMYVMDERFLKNIDKFGKGTAEKMSEAIKAYLKG